MAQILDPLPLGGSSTCILCCYVNTTSRIQVARVTDVPNWYFERVVFPGQRLVFEAPPEAHLEIHTGMMASAILSDTISCDRLTVQEELTQTLSYAIDEDQAISEHERLTSDSDRGLLAEAL